MPKWLAGLALILLPQLGLLFVATVGSALGVLDAIRARRRGRTHRTRGHRP